jgi:uncharacterized protein YecT (DUF1311 family)
MNRIARTALVLTVISAVAGAYIAGRHAAYAQTQLEMNESAYQDFLKADAKLNAVYVKLLHSYNPKDEYEGRTHTKIIAAEKAWITYRDAEADMFASMEAEGGSLYPAIFSNECAALTEDRTKAIEAEVKVINSR